MAWNRVTSNGPLIALAITAINLVSVVVIALLLPAQLAGIHQRIHQNTVMMDEARDRMTVGNRQAEKNYERLMTIDDATRNIIARIERLEKIVKD